MPCCPTYYQGDKVLQTTLESHQRITEAQPNAIKAASQLALTRCQRQWPGETNCGCCKKAAQQENLCRSSTECQAQDVSQQPIAKREQESHQITSPVKEQQIASQTMAHTSLVVGTRDAPLEWQGRQQAVISS